MPISHLADRGVVSVGGPDAKGFLDGLLTCDMDRVAPGRARFGALLTPQGKILFDFIVHEASRRRRRLPPRRAEALRARPRQAARLLQAAGQGDGRGRVGALRGARGLGRRAEAGRAGRPRLGRSAPARPRLAGDLAPSPRVRGEGWGEGGQGDEPQSWRPGAIGRFPRRDALRRHPLTPALSPRAGRGGSFRPTAYHAHRIALGVPEGGRDFLFGDAFPHEALMDQLHGVDFDKGCYVGQEVVSRMQHRGTARSRIVPLVYLDGFATEPGVEVTAGERVIGKAGTGANGRGLALLRLDRAADALAAGETIRAGGLPRAAGEAGLDRAFPSPARSRTTAA